LNDLNHSLERNILFLLTELGLSCYYAKKPKKIATELKQCWTKKLQLQEKWEEKWSYLLNYLPMCILSYLLKRGFKGA